MFGDLFGNMEEKQEEMRSRLAEMTVEAEAGDGAVKVTATATREIVNLSIDRSRLDWEDTEQVEDLVLTAINRALELAAEKEAEETQKFLKDMMPPGFGGLEGLFG
ncbi:MAG: YbaB/EbfC family nucleoid-associated protein [Saprospiraceae bacterium]|nr:YbaB/EbfC family nucleoid-associated protein [Saprospiraceae bacterium]MCB0622994.1 YbaB/EbfC family nucleoid-associated protein [Saprospiraceae bacterium]MCB0679211.1 YbaB/EbfC family nucleoid-associated protein [Saprospiraceae bacterium]MCB0680154.1 YbaB/EbfC family nucleoid-associated protein [Saprospiraceae bacterium]